jgi:hypothetical protein
MNFLVSVMCAAHISACPIPKGYHASVQVQSKQECEQMAKSYIAAFGYQAIDFRVHCREKTS